MASATNPKRALTRSTLADLKRHPAVVQLYDEYVTLKNTGDRYVGMCPFHNDGKNPGFNIYRADDGSEALLYKCFHDDDCKGDIFKFLQEMESIDFNEARRMVEDAVEDYLPDDRQGPSTRSRVREQAPPLAKETFTYDVAQLKQYAAALDEEWRADWNRWWNDTDTGLFDFFDDRAITIRVAKDLQLGYTIRCNRPTLVIPYGWKGKLTGIKYRVGLGDDRDFIQEPGSKTDYLIGADRAPISELPVCFIVEGDTDLWCILSLGFNAVSIANATGVPSQPSERFLESVELLKAKYQHIVPLGDNDDSGQKAIGHLQSYFPNTIVERIPEGKDLCQFVAAKGREYVVSWLQDLSKRAIESGSVSADADTEQEVAAADNAMPQLSDEALYGLAGDIVKKLKPETESHPAALLVEILARFGNVIGRTAYYEVESTKHYGNLFVVKVGRSSKARKGTATGRIKRIFEEVDPYWSKNCIQRGVSSGEGIIQAVRDKRVEMKDVLDKKGNVVDQKPEIVDHGAKEKRLYISESEFAGVLAMTKREGNTISAVLRIAWDGEQLAVLTKHNPARATEAHVSLVGDITFVELHKMLADNDKWNGFANRILWSHTQRVQLKPFGGEDLDFSLEIKQLKEAVEFAKNQKRVYMTKNARETWSRTYLKMAENDEEDGIFAAVTARGEAQIIRLALLYAMLDKSLVIDTAHLRAAIAFWNYCEDSARYIFGGMTADQRKIVEFLTGTARSKTEIYRECFQGHRKSEAIATDLHGLIKAKKIYSLDDHGIERFKARN